MSMNQQQKEFLAALTCGILDKYDHIEINLESHGIPKRLINKMSKAFNLIFEVNQECVVKEK